MAGYTTRPKAAETRTESSRGLYGMLQVGKGSRKLVVSVLFLLAVATQALYVPLLWDTGDKEYINDEGFWIASGDYYFQLFFVDRDPTIELWNSDQFLEWGPRTGPVGKYLVGLWLHVAGLGDRHHSAPPWDFLQGVAENRLQGNLAPANELAAARHAVSCSGSMAVIVLFLLVRALFCSWLVALVAAVFFGLAPLTIRYSTHVMVDIPMLLFSFMALWCFLKSLASLTRKLYGQGIFWSVATGVALGLAVGTKLNSLLVPGIIASWGLGKFFSSRFEECRDHQLSPFAYLVAGAAILAVGVVTFVLLNPFLYPTPVRNFKYMLELGTIVLDTKILFSKICD